jgi:probable addiction module antidote protein
MSTVFIGGSRHVSRLPTPAKDRLDNIVKSGFHIVVGDANGADKSVQKHLSSVAYPNVEVFCSGDACRNNLGDWPTRNVRPAKNVKGYQFYAAKDREMANMADFGLMIWDGKSPGTVLNVLRLIKAGKKAVLFNSSEAKTTTFKGVSDWEAFLARCDESLKNDLRQRATPEEWSLHEAPQPDLLAPVLPCTAPAEPSPTPTAEAPARLDLEINQALRAGDSRRVVELLGAIARDRGMSQVAKDSGLARESLYRSLGADGNPEFATVLKVLASLGLTLTASRAA